MHEVRGALCLVGFGVPSKKQEEREHETGEELGPTLFDMVR